MSDSAAAFANFPSEARGILLAKTYQPISLHTADVHVLFSGYAAQVTLSLEYVNETNQLVQAIAAYPVPPGFQLQSTTLTGPNRAVATDAYQQSRAVRAAETGSKLPAKSLYDTMTAAVATQTVPWDLSPGDAVRMTSVYHAPLAQIQRQSEIAFTMPTSLFPAVVRPPEAQRSYVKTATTTAIATDDRSCLRRDGKAGRMHVTVEGQLYRPLRGTVTLDKGGYVIETEDPAELKVAYVGDSGFCLTYQGALPTKAYTQQALTVRAPVGETVEPLRLHSVTVPPTATDCGAAAVALTMAPTFANCPVNAELVFLIDVHTPAMAQDVAAAVAAVISPTLSPMPASVHANVLICNDTRRNGCVALFSAGSVPLASIPQASVLAYMKEEIAQNTTKVKKGSLVPATVYSPQLPAVLHDVLAGYNVATAVPTGYVRNVILLSDAGGLAKASESATMISDAATFATNTRVHCVALGPTADQATLETLAVTAGGRFRCPATTTVPSNSTAAAEKCDLVLALHEVLVAAAVPCLVEVRTTWKLASPSPVGLVRLAANADGTNLPCIPRHTKRVLYGLLMPPTPAQQQQQAEQQMGNNASQGEGGAREREDLTPPQLNVGVTGRVGNLALEFTAATLITRIADAQPLPPPVSVAAAAGGGFAEPQQDASSETRTAGSDERAGEETQAPAAGELRQNEPHSQSPGVLSVKNLTSQEGAGVSPSPMRDSASAGSVGRASATSPTRTPVKRNGNTLLLHTAAAAARIAFLSNGYHVVTASEALEMIQLSQRCMLPSPFTTLTDGKAPLTVEQKKGSVVYAPSVGAKAQIAVAIRTRQAEVAATASSTSSRSGTEGKGDSSPEKGKPKTGKKGIKDTASLFSMR
ncbi:putative mitochondrial hypothetical protein [Leptomonas pyrrhocoris]|uniref:VWFA domain-containing protein n=1 Tax=Leptomonas pyrrhocoris TaxID=157538 RepID=A0A0M9FW56_LEPPY|nr:putative mitochondrial hypothetical protein [Leptomonas pyrrhocoris]XP_015655616.1 putative mitochondrial hypothetical protein [Leptomonas pyrrhocoris]KPA77176.1 putative mitochondrial hypothetical protein [Leptomonas pyrrhocoris]KPA77177.1 putative mitochondrial hypothetical protein [Leptomonas pyrrhocoris]|eukprot:XP_015655615.1 putative mitochondrial hypothetical protein [Leptomonas pyrrhocoris]